MRSSPRTGVLENSVEQESPRKLFIFDTRLRQKLGANSRGLNTKRTDLFISGQFTQDGITNKVVLKWDITVPQGKAVQCHYDRTPNMLQNLTLPTTSSIIIFVAPLDIMTEERVLTHDGSHGLVLPR